MKKHTGYLWALAIVLILSVSGAWTSLAVASVGTTGDDAAMTIAKGGKKKEAREARDAGKKSKKAAEKAAKKHGKRQAKKAGMDAEKIKSVQEALAADGYTLKLTGKMDKNTRKALKQYQKKNKLKVTGKPDKATMKALGV